jgi:Domain of unknown function (DUF6134)
MLAHVHPPSAPPRVRSPGAAGLARRWTALLLVLAGLGADPAVAARAEWLFTVRLDGKPIGMHRFVLASSDDHGLTLSSDAKFDVSLLGVSLLRYAHRVNERWANGCLASIDARTDDNGRVLEVRGRIEGDRFDLQVRQDGRPVATSEQTAGCLMSFAYWNPALAKQTRLLDPGSGRVEVVAIDAATTAPADLENNGARVRGLRIAGLAQPIDVWYAGDRWVGLDTLVGGGRRLSYRLK